MSDDKHKEIDDVSGVETTGHEWDGLKELNNPLPRWWLWVWLVTIIWGVWYFIAYPAWPTKDGATKGTSEYTQYKELIASQEEIAQIQQQYAQAFSNADFDEILADPALYNFALSGGSSAFKDNCATCHGSGAAGSKGYPNLNDDDWLWGGKITDIYQTIQYGIRADNWDTRISAMPAFGKDGLLNTKEINAVVDYVLSLSAHGHKDHHADKTTIMAGKKIFAENCASCHGTDARGDHEFGAPNLADAIWLYGGDHDSVFASVYNARAGMMPAWHERLDDNTIRQLSVYVHQLGGGE